MPNVLIRDVPDEVHATLQQRARSKNQSLQQYLTSELKSLAERPTVEEVLDRIDQQRSGGRGGFEEAVTALEQERNRE